MPQDSLRLLDLMRQTEDPKVINLAAGIPSPDFLPLDALKAALEGEMSSRAREMFSYHRPEGAAPPPGGDPRLSGDSGCSRHS